MLNIIVRTRPNLSPSQPKSSPPAAAPRRNNAAMPPFHAPTNDSSVTFKRSCSAGRATMGNKPISSPSNIQPENAAANTIQCALVKRVGWGSFTGGFLSCFFVRRRAPYDS